MICFDQYPFKCNYDTGVPTGGPYTGWYSELRRYRQWAMTYNIPFGVYRQTFHSVEPWSSTIYRDPSPSELRLNTSAALAFNAKTLINFTYNTGASSLFTNPGGDTYPTPLYAEQVDANRRAYNLGKALVCLTPIYDLHNPSTTPPPPGPARSIARRRSASISTARLHSAASANQSKSPRRCASSPAPPPPT